MDLVAIAGSIWRHKVAVIPVLLLTLLAMFYILAVKPPTYQSKAIILLTNPPSPPTAAQIAANPSLAHINANNPYTSLGNLVLVADVLIEVVTSSAAQQQLVQEGATPGYQVALDVSFDSPPAIDVTGVATNANAAIQSAQLVASAVSKDLVQLQEQQNVNSRYMIGSIEYVKPTTASASSSSKLRTLIGVMAIGFILLIVVVSISQAFQGRRDGKSRRASQGATRSAGSRNADQSPGAGFREPVAPYGGDTDAQQQWPSGHPGEPQPYPVRRPEMHPMDGNPEMHPMGGNGAWDQRG